MQNNQKKWGLLNSEGNEIQPFTYDAVDYGAWGNKENAHAVVTQNGKKDQVGPCGKALASHIYDKLRVSTSENTAVVAKKGKDTVPSTKTATRATTAPIPTNSA